MAVVLIAPPNDTIGFVLPDPPDNRTTISEDVIGMMSVDVVGDAETLRRRRIEVVGHAEALCCGH